GKGCVGQACCGGACADTAADVMNCGQCGKVCMTMNAAPACKAGKCAVGMCNAGFADCDGLPANGCEVDTNNDRDNCLGCGNGCVAANGMADCNMGCTITSCNMGFADCNKMYQDGCEASIDIDPAHC